MKKNEPPCPICNASSRLYSEGTIEGKRFFTNREQYTIAEGAKRSKLAVYQCLSCSHGFSLPGVEEAVLQHWYSDAAKDTLFMADERARRRTAKKVLDQLAKILQNPARLFEVGTGPGFFLDEARRRGWTVAGLEPATWATRYMAEQLKLTTVNKGTYKQMFNLEAGSYDVVAAFDVIEHLTNPNNFLLACNHLLSNGGVLIMTMPKFDSLLARIMGKRWHPIFPAHLHYFSASSLKNMLARNKMNIEHIFPHTRHLGMNYFLTRTLPMMGLNKTVPWTKKSKRAIILPINFRDEFEVYARKAS